MVRPTIKQQQILAQKSRKTKPESSTELPTTPESSTESTNAPETSTDTLETPTEPSKRDKQVTVKFSDQDMARLKTAAGKARRPVANLIYSLTMDFVETSEG